MQCQQNESNSHMNNKQGMFHNVPLYHNKSIQGKIFTLETKLQEQFDKYIQAKNEHQNLLRKLHLLEQQKGYHQTKCRTTREKVIRSQNIYGMKKGYPEANRNSAN
jgi:hypothetical protein